MKGHPMLYHDDDPIVPLLEDIRNQIRINTESQLNVSSTIIKFECVMIVMFLIAIGMEVFS